MVAFRQANCYLKAVGKSLCDPAPQKKHLLHLLVKKVLIKDHRNVVPVAREFIAEHGLQERISAQPGDFLEPDDYPADCDLISYITPLHWYLRDDVVKVINLLFTNYKENHTDNESLGAYHRRIESDAIIAILKKNTETSTLMEKPFNTSCVID